MTSVIETSLAATPARAVIRPEDPSDPFRAFIGNPGVVALGAAWVACEDKVPVSVPNGAARPSFKNGPLAGSYDAAREVARTIQDKPGVSLVVGDRGDGWTLVLFDLDGVRNPETGQIDPWALELVDALQTFTEVSVSGTGLHALFWLSADDAQHLRALIAQRRKDGKATDNWKWGPAR